MEPSIDDYLVLASLLVGVRCETPKQRIDATATELTLPVRLAVPRLA